MEQRVLSVDSFNGLDQSPARIADRAPLTGQSDCASVRGEQPCTDRGCSQKFGEIGRQGLQNFFRKTGPPEREALCSGLGEGTGDH